MKNSEYKVVYCRQNKLGDIEKPKEFISVQKTQMGKLASSILVCFFEFEMVVGHP